MTTATPPVRVLLLNASGERGGAELALATLLRHFDRRICEARVCSLKHGPFVDELRRRGADVDVVATGPLRDVRSGRETIRRLAELVRREGHDVLHSSGSAAHLYGGLAAARAGIRSVFHVHDRLEWRADRQGLLHGLARLVPATAAVAASAYSAAVVGRFVRCREVLTIPYGLDPEDRSIRSEPEAVGCRASEATAHPVVLWCGRLQRWKGAHVFVEAAAMVHRAVPSARFVVVGGSLFGLEPDYAPALRDRAAALGLSGAMRFTGHIDDVGPEFHAADVVVHSSIRPEPFGLVLIEAMLAARPVVASAAGGPLEIVVPDQTGLLVEPGDPGALAAALCRLLGDRGLRQSMGAAGFRRARERFSARHMARRFEALYARLTGRVAAHPAAAHDTA